MPKALWLRPKNFTEGDPFSPLPYAGVYSNLSKEDVFFTSEPGRVSALNAKTIGVIAASGNPLPFHESASYRLHFDTHFRTSIHRQNLLADFSIPSKKLLKIKIIY